MEYGRPRSLKHLYLWLLAVVALSVLLRVVEWALS
jgi:hypothetical protein